MVDKVCVTAAYKDGKQALSQTSQCLTHRYIARRGSSSGWMDVSLGVITRLLQYTPIRSFRAKYLLENPK